MLLLRSTLTLWRRAAKVIALFWFFKFFFTFIISFKRRSIITIVTVRVTNVYTPYTIAELFLIPIGAIIVLLFCYYLLSQSCKRVYCLWSMPCPALPQDVVDPSVGFFFDNSPADSVIVSWTQPQTVVIQATPVLHFRILFYQQILGLWSSSSFFPPLPSGVVLRWIKSFSEQFLA